MGRPGECSHRLRPCMYGNAGEREPSTLETNMATWRRNVGSQKLCLLIIDTDICKIPGYPLLKCQKVVADRFSEVDGEWLLRRSSSLVNPALYFVTGEKF
ncbi:hypothetical protein AVEN_176980-1 [Araneus ventricosus]|uniref:Uncharacterized protein n=1 Tax=Araneus ventricosus TaxID=182803 RepID=A0A4Y2LD25_ARAVE|nr:hypothetical protein AVEN_176980-1 [Araneus ventricosus]